MSIFSQLPNDLIMRIIRETKSSIDFKEEHEDNYILCMTAIEEIGEEYKVHQTEECEKVRTGEIFYLPNFIETDQFFCGLYHAEELTNNIIQYRRNGHH